MMETVLLQVRFANGHILYGQYNVRYDGCHPNLFDSAEEAGSHCRNTYEGWIALTQAAKSPPEAEDVEMYVDIEGGRYWSGKACRKTKQITHHLILYDCHYDYNQERIFNHDWAREP